MSRRSRKKNTNNNTTKNTEVNDLGRFTTDVDYMKVMPTDSEFTDEFYRDFEAEFGREYDEAFDSYYGSDKTDEFDDKVISKNAQHVTLNSERLRHKLGKSTMDDVFELDAASLQKYLEKHLRARGRKSIQTEDFLYSSGTFPVLLVAHMDTVHTDAPLICKSANNNVWMAPQGIGGDDRCGIWIILNILEKYDCHVLFTQDEEIGCLGARAFTMSGIIPSVNYIVEIDRQSDNDAVFYDCDNLDFIDFVLDTTGYVESIGSYSDISVISPSLDLASVNLSSGYYSPHSNSEFIILSDMQKTMNATLDMLDATDKHKVFKFDKKPPKTYSYSKYTPVTPLSSANKRYTGYDVYDEDYYDAYSGFDRDAKNYKSQSQKEFEEKETGLTEKQLSLLEAEDKVPEKSGLFLPVDDETFQKLQEEEDKEEFSAMLFDETEMYIKAIIGYVPDAELTEEISIWMEGLLEDYGVLTPYNH